MRDEKWESNWIGGGILLSGVFFDLTQFNFHGLLFSQKKEDHPHHQDQNHYEGEYKDVSKEVHHPPLARALWALEPSENSEKKILADGIRIGRASVPV